MTAETRGWGKGWPNCQRDKIVPLQVAGVKFPGGVRKETYPIFHAFAIEFHQKVEPLVKGWCWGFACRAIGGTSRPSNHSWGLALDLNAPNHPWGSVGTFSVAQASTIRKLCKKYGLRWGGDYRGKKDEMHVEFMGSPSDAKRIIADLGLGITWPSGDEEMLDRNSPSGDAVKYFQTALKGWNSNALPQYGADGDFGSETEEWVKKYQKAADLEVTGTIGEVTATLLARHHPENDGAGKHDHDERYAKKHSHTHTHRATVNLD